MTATQLFDDLSTRLERLQQFNTLVDQLDALCLSLEVILADHSIDEAHLERLRLAAYKTMIAAHNAQQETNAAAANAGSEGVL
jgi:hypothetical protein